MSRSIITACSVQDANQLVRQQRTQEGDIAADERQLRKLQEELDAATEPHMRRAIETQIDALKTTTDVAMKRRRDATIGSVHHARMGV
jgi:hypothetical protein